MRFKIRAGRRELNFANPFAKIEPLTLFRWLPQQSLQPSPQIRGLADVRLAFASQQEDRRRSRDLLEKVVLAIRRECECARQHKLIVMMPVALLRYLKNSFIGAAVALAPG